MALLNVFELSQTMLLILEPPSEPRNVVVTSVTSTSITLTWDPPESLGGRNDTRYIIWWYQEEGTFDKMRSGTVNTTFGTITGSYNLLS